MQLAQQGIDKNVSKRPRLPTTLAKANADDPTLIERAAA
jgi:hypothetical protein